MPNCDFYALGKDLREILAFVFDELDCRVYELYSAPDSELREFKTVEEIVELENFGKCKGNAQSILLQLWPQSASGLTEIRKIELDPKACKGAAFRYQFCGWGLIQFYLGGASKLGVIHSHTNHNSEKRAQNWASTDKDQEAVSSWNWKEVSRVSSKLNRHIRKLSVSNFNSRPVLPEAQRELEVGNNAL